MGDRSEWPRAAQPIRGGRPFLVPRGQAACRCARWTFRDIQIVTPLAVIERLCPKCRSRVLLVFRGPEHVATLGLVFLSSSDAAGLRRLLEKTSLEDHEVETLMAVAGEMVS